MNVLAGFHPQILPRANTLKPSPGPERRNKRPLISKDRLEPLRRISESSFNVEPRGRLAPRSILLT